MMQDIVKGNLMIELFNLNNDFQELTDMAREHPDIIKRMETIMVKEHVPATLVLFKMKQIGILKSIDAEQGTQ